MDRMKTFGKYILIVLAIFAFSQFLIFVGLNVNYKDIVLNSDLPTQVQILKAETKSNQGRIYGEISNSEDNNLNGKYIKTEILDENFEKLDIQYLRIDGAEFNKQTMFKVFFRVEGAKYYNIYIVDSENS